LIFKIKRNEIYTLLGAPAMVVT